MAYTKYESENVILPYTEFPNYQQIEKIEPVQKIQPYTPYRGWDDERKAIYNARKNKQVETFLANYNDPTELNSYIDALTNREAVSKKFGDAWGTISTASGTVAVLSFVGSIIAGLIPGGQPVAAALATTAKIAALPAIPAAADVTINKGIKPILAGKPKEAALNTLMNLGETMDYVSNPIKGLFIEGPEGFIKGTGLAEGGRVNYDFDTGSFVTDMLLEVLSDPINLFQMGAGMAVKSTAKTIAKPLAKQLADTTQNVFQVLDKKIYGEFTEEIYETIEKKMTKAYANAIKTLNDATTQKLSKEAKQLVLETTRNSLQQQYKTALKEVLPKLSNEQLDIVMKKAGRSTITGRFTKSTLSQIQNIPMDKLSSNVIQNLSRGLQYSEDFEKFMTKHAFMTSGYGAGIKVAKEGFKPISQYIQNTIIQKLRKPNLIDPKIGIDLMHFEQAKNTWINSSKYMQEITGEISPLDETAFYNYITQQFNRDRQLIDQIIDQNRLHPVKQGAALDSAIETLYSKFGIKNFEQYISVLKGIDEANNGMFTKFVTHAENVFKVSNEKALAKGLGAKLQKGVQLLSGSSPESYMKSRIKALEDLAKIAQTNKELDFGKTIYILKQNDEFINAMLVNNPKVIQAFEQIIGSDKVGAFLDNVMKDIKTLEPEMQATYFDAVRALKEAGNAFRAVKTLYDNVGELVLDEVPGINAKQLKRYIIDEIFGLDKGNVSDLLANFDNVTMNRMMEGLSMMLSDLGFNEANYPAMRLQIAQVLKQYLEDLDAAGIEYIKTGIAQNFTSNVATLDVLFGEKYIDAFTDLNLASSWIKETLSQVGVDNYNLSNIMGNTILDAFNVRQLSDYGLAVRAINMQEILDYFTTEGLDGVALQQAERIGKSMKHLKERFTQYNFFFTDKKEKQINYVYNRFYRNYIANKKSHLTIEAFRNLKYSKDPIEQFAQLVEFNKSLYDDKLEHRAFMQLFGTPKDMSSWELLQDIRNPSRLLNTDFAWDAMAQTAWLAQREFNDTIINGILAYKNVGLRATKLTNDFRAMRELLTQNKLDRPKALMLERYIRAAEPTEKYLARLKDYYNSLYDTDVAIKKIESLRDVCTEFPDFDRKYSDLITELDEYWKGTKTFRQDPKYMRNAADYTDNYTPFWNKIKTMNNDLRKLKPDMERVTPWDPFRKQIEYNKILNKTTDAQAKGSLYNLLKRSPQEFAEELAFRKRLIVFEDADINGMFTPKQFEYINKQFEKNNIHHVYDAESHMHWYVLDKDAYKVEFNGSQVCLNSNPLVRTIKNSYSEYDLVDKHTKDFKHSLTKQLQDWDESMYTLTGSRIGSSQGEVITQDSFNKLFAKDKDGKCLVPEDVMKHLPTDEYGNVYFDKSYFENYIFNETILGTGNTKRKFGVYASNMITNMDNATAQAQQFLKPKVEYVNTVFDSQLSISSPNSIWTKFSDEDLLQALQETPDYKLVALVEDSKYGSKVQEIIPTSINNIKKARELGAVIVPLQTFKDMYGVCNHRLGSTGFSKLWSRIMYAYKFGYLCRPGAWIRNFIDTNLKSKIEMGDMYSSYQAQAHKILNDVDNLKQYIHKVTHDAAELEENIGSIKQLTERWFKDGNAKYLSYDQYLELQNDFLSQGISGNVGNMLTKEFGDSGTAWQQFTRVTGNIIDATNRTEDYNRLAMYLYELDKGADYTSALAKLAKTHFDYSFKTKAEQLVDMVFPFTTFTLRNYSYWVEALEKQPWLLKNYVHLMKPHWDFKDYTPQELARDKRVQTQILYGQLKLAEFDNKVLTFKANPSIQDAIQMFSDPINNVYEKLAAPIKMATGQEAPSIGSIPMVGPALQAIQTTAKTGSPVPSMIGVQPAPKRTGQVNFTNTNLSGIDKYIDNTYRTPKYRNNTKFDAYQTKGITSYRKNFYPVIDIAHELKMKYTTNVYAKIKNKVQVDVYKGIRYRIRLDANRFR